jgi:hypothetical protein
MGLYRQAAYCLEEVLTLAPSEPNVVVRYADVLLTLGGAANARAARAYYSRAVTLTQGRSARALYGLVACAAQLQVRGRRRRRRPLWGRGSTRVAAGSRVRRRRCVCVPQMRKQVGPSAR